MRDNSKVRTVCRAYLLHTFFLALFIWSPQKISATSLNPINKALIKRLNLTEADLEYIQDSRIPEEKVEMLYLAAGVSLNEYFQYPWLKLNISEQEWLTKRGAGLIKADPEAIGLQRSSADWAVVHNFFVPGLHQFKRKQHLKGYLMAGVAVSSMLLYVFHRNPDQANSIGFGYPGYLLLLGADLLWSSIDIGAQIRKEANPTASQFTYTNDTNNLIIAASLPLSVRKCPYVQNVSVW